MSTRAEIGSWVAAVGATLAFVGVIVGVIVVPTTMWNESWTPDSTMYGCLALAALAVGVVLYLLGEHLESTPPPSPEREEKETQ